MANVAMNLGLLASLLLLTLACLYSKWGGWAVLAATTLGASAICAIAGPSLSPFTWLKMYTLVVSAAWLHQMRHHGWIPWKVAVWGMWGALVLNMAEAVVMDALQGLWINSACGALLVASLWSYRQMSITEDSGRHLAWPLPVSWILAYTLWNITFVSGKYGWHLSDHLIVLGIPLLWVLLRSDRWLEVRAYSLTLYVLILVTFVEALRTAWPVNYLSSQVRSGMPRSEELRIALTAATAILTAVHVADRARHLLQRPAAEAESRARPRPK